MLKNLINSIQEGHDIPSHDFPLLKLKRIAKTFKSMQNVFKKRVVQKDLTKKQKIVIEEFDKLDQALHSTNLIEKACREKLSIWELLTDEETHIKMMKQGEFLFEDCFDDLRKDLGFEFEDQEKSSFIIGQCDMLGAKLESIIYSKGFFAGIWRGMFEKYLFGTIDHVLGFVDINSNIVDARGARETV